MESFTHNVYALPDEELLGSLICPEHRNQLLIGKVRLEPIIDKVRANATHIMKDDFDNKELGLLFSECETNSTWIGDVKIDPIIITGRMIDDQ